MITKITYFDCRDILLRINEKTKQNYKIDHIKSLDLFSLTDEYYAPIIFDSYPMTLITFYHFLMGIELGINLLTEGNK